MEHHSLKALVLTALPTTPSATKPLLMQLFRRSTNSRACRGGAAIQIGARQVEQAHQARQWQAPELAIEAIALASQPAPNIDKGIAGPRPVVRGASSQPRRRIWPFQVTSIISSVGGCAQQQLLIRQIRQPASVQRSRATAMRSRTVGRG